MMTRKRKNSSVTEGIQISMADRSGTKAQAFDSPSPSSSSPCGSERKDEKEECQELQNTVPFGDTMALATLSVETQLEKLDFDTEVVDDLDCVENMRPQPMCDYEEEVVLDSEDEGIHRTKGVSVVNELSYSKSGGRVKGNTVDLLKRQLGSPCEQLEDMVADSDASAGKHCSAGTKGSSIAFEGIDCRKVCPQLLMCDQKVAKLSYVGSQEPGEASQANALDFVNHFLSFNNMESPQGIDPRKNVREKLFTASSAKGTRSLAKRIQLRDPVGQTGAFEWVDSDLHGGGDFVSKRMEESIYVGGCKQRSVNRHQKARNLDSAGSSSVYECKEKKQNVNLHKDEMVSTQSDSRFVEHSPKEICRIEEVSEMISKNNSVKALDRHVHTEPSGLQLEARGIESDIPDMFDVGVNTQIAAEAMEALLYGPPASCSVSDAYQGLQNTSKDFLTGLSNSKAVLEQPSLQKSAWSDLGAASRESNKRKRSARKFSRGNSSSSHKHSNNQESDPELATSTKAKRHKLLASGQLTWRNPAYANETSGRQSSKPIKHRKAEGAVSRKGIEECENYLSSSMPIERNSLGKRQSQEEPVAHQTRHWTTERISKGTKDQSSNPGERTNDVMKCGILTYRRKRRDVVSDSSGVMCSRGKCSKLHFVAPGEARNSKLNQQEQTSLEVAAITSYASNYPRGKRTRRKVQSHSKGSNLCAPFTMVDGKESNTLSITGQQRSGGIDKTACFKFDMKGKSQSMYTSLFQHSSEMNSEKGLLRQNFVEPADLIRSKTFSKSGKLDDMVSTSLINRAEKIHKFEVSSEKKVEPSGPEFTTSVNCIKGIKGASTNNMPCEHYKKPYNKNLPKSSLLKELIRLGIPESIPDFTWKDLRRRRDMASVKVLFSQHLDDDIIKQQKKKILARLGISIATCSTDATHFIADRFVRTKNMLEAVALGKPVVTHLWLESCGQASCLIDEKNYILRDAKKEKEIGFSMPVSLARASQHPLLKGRRVFITPNIKPNKEMISSLVKAVHGQAVERSQISVVKGQKIPDDLLILSCEEDHDICLPFLDKGAAVYSSELLLNGIVVQTLEYQRHQLFMTHSKRTRPGTRSKKRGDLSLPVIKCN